MDLQNPVLRVVPSRSDINSNGHIFGGWILAQMDIAGGITAGRRAGGPVATVAIESMKFHQPILLGDILSLNCTIPRVGTTSVSVEIEVIANRRSTGENIKVTEGLFTFVAIDADGRKRPVDAHVRTA